MKKELLLFMVGIMIGYALVQGFSYLQTNYLWAFFLSRLISFFKNKSGLRQTQKT